MDFYYAMTNYHVLCCLLHKMYYNTNSARLYISSFLRFNQPKLVENIKKSGIFEEVFFYEELEYTKTKTIMKNSEIEREIDRLCKTVDKAVGKTIKESSDIYICSDFYSIGLYLITNEIKYNYFEDSCGILSKPYIPLKIIEKENANRAIIVKKTRALGENKYVIRRYANLECQESGYSNSKDEDFSVQKLLKGLSKKDINKLLIIFDTSRIDIKKEKAILLLTLHYNELKSIEEQKKIYTNLVDYFADENKIIIKPHPADTITDYGKIFKDSKTINRYMPSELFPYCINGKFEKGITCWSTSIYSLGDILKKIVNFDIRIDQTYKDFDKYYAIVEFLKVLKSDKKTNIIFKNVNELQFERLIENYIPNYKRYFTFEDDQKDSIYIVDRIIYGLNDKKVISLEYEKDSTNLIHINKKSKSKEEDYFISLYNIKIRDIFNINKKLKYSRYELNIEYIEKKDYKEVMYKVVKNQEKNIKNIISKYEDKIESLENDIESKSKDLNKLYESTSWKLTTPIRKVGDMLRKIKKHL